MKYLKFFESESSNLISNIEEVFEDMRDFGFNVECENMYCAVVELPRKYKLEGYYQNKEIDTFFGYFTEHGREALEWCDGEGYSIHDYVSTDPNNPYNTPYKDHISLFRDAGQREYFHSVFLHGNQQYMIDNFESIFSEINNSVLRLNNMYDLNLHTNQDIWYRNGISYDILYSSRDFVELDWLDKKGSLDIVKGNPRLVNSKEGYCSLNIYFK